MEQPPVNLLVFGYGYTSRAFVRANRGAFTDVAATVRSPGKAATLAQDGVRGLEFQAGGWDASLPAAIDAADAILVSIPPDNEGDPVLRVFADRIAAAPNLRWIGY